MKLTRNASGVVATLSLGAIFMMGGAISASASDTDQIDSWQVPQTQKADPGYWTAERMEAALPGETLIADNIAAETASPQASVEVGDAITVKKQAATGQSSTTSANRQAAPRPVPRATRQAPVSHIGKVFFTLGGQDFVCSGNAISAANENTVVTAGHCVNEGPGAFATQFTFVPAYENGNAPYGQWAATELFAPTQWSSSGDITYDTGFAVVSSPTGTSLSDTVGASAVSFNKARALSYTLYGYPAGAPFTGETLQSCAGNATADPFGQSQSQGVPCNMTGGSSGGPWFIGGGSTGVQNSVNSFGYNAVANTMFGPYWGSVIQSAYAQASS